MSIELNLEIPPPEMPRMIIVPLPGGKAPEAVIGCGLINLHLRGIEIQLKHFPNGTIAGLLNHLHDETFELREDPGNQEEWADVLILLLAAAWRRGHTPCDLVRFANAKMDINETRQWPKEPDANGIYHHENETKPTD